MTAYRAARLDDGDQRLYEGDCIDVMPDIGPVDAIVTDPPYGLGFMGKDWDSPGGTGDFPMRRTTEANTVNTGVTRQGGRQRSCADFARRQARDARSYQEWCETWASVALSILKPGGHILAFGGTRTYHRLTCALEDAGFEIRDCLMWLYGSGFPKSHNIGKGWGTALKPAWEPIILARKPLIGTVAANVARDGTGALNIDGCRIGTSDDTLRRASDRGTMLGRMNDDGWQPKAMDTADHPNGRWPANLVLDEDAAEALDDQTGDLAEAWSAPMRQEYDATSFHIPTPPEVAPNTFGDKGGASRFFYTAKATREERNAGLHALPEREATERHAYTGLPDLRMDHEQQRRPSANHHPTVKPVALMRWLIRLVTPPGGVILDPFVGSGSTLVAARAEGFRGIGIDREVDYLRIAAGRLSQLSLLGGHHE